MKAIAILLVLAFVALPEAAQPTAQLDATVQAHVDKQAFTGAVLVARGDEIVLSKGYGAANREWEIANTPSTKFRIGSVTKQFTAASILLLEERGKLRIDDPVSKHVPDAPASWHLITLHHLLTHTSGIPSFTGLPGYAALQGLATTPEKTMAMVRDKPLEFAPGEKMAYNNSGYVILGLIIERLSGQSYATFVEQNIFVPVGMKNSGYDSNSAIIPRRAMGYTPTANEIGNAGFIHMSVPHAAGALYSTTEDLLRWQRALFSGKVLSAASHQKMLTPAKNNYALGVSVRTTDGRRVIAHSGGINGFNSYLAHYPESGVTVVVLSNLNGPTADQLAAQLGALAHGAAESRKPKTKSRKLQFS